SNMQSAALPDLLRRYIFDRERGAPMRDWSAEAYAQSLVQRRRADSVEKVQLAEHRENAQSPIPLKAFEGTFVASLYGELTVTPKDGGLELARGSIRAPLIYWNANNF